MYMRRRMYFWYDAGTIEFSPKFIDDGMSDIKEILDEEQYNELATIDDEQLVAEYYKTFAEWQKAKGRILDEMWRCKNCQCWNFRDQICHHCGELQK